MSDYFKAYRRRMEEVSKLILSLAENVINGGGNVYKSRDSLTKFILIEKGGRHIVFGFSEVPYRFYADVLIKPSRERGSSYNKREWFPKDFSTQEKDYIPSTREVVELMEQNYPGMLEENRHLIKI